MIHIINKHIRLSPIGVGPSETVKGLMFDVIESFYTNAKLPNTFGTTQ